MVNTSLVPIITYLPEKPYSTHALSILHEVAHRVESIMLKRGYKIGALCEFYPPSGLWGMNINGGEKILLRLRSSQDESELLDVDEIVGTMLHELVHNVYRGHGVDFHKRLEEHMIEYAILRVAIQQRDEKLAMETEKANGEEKIVSVSRTAWPMLTTTTKEEAADTIATENKTEEAAAGQAADSIATGNKTEEAAAGQAADSVATENKTEEVAAEQQALAQVFRKMDFARRPVDPSEKTPGPALLQWDCVYCTLKNIQCLTDCMACGGSRL